MPRKRSSPIQCLLYAWGASGFSEKLEEHASFLLRELHERAHQFGWQVVGAYSDSNYPVRPARPGFDKLLLALGRSRGADVVLVRRIEELYATSDDEDEFQRYGKGKTLVVTANNPRREVIEALSRRTTYRTMPLP